MGFFSQGIEWMKLPGLTSAHELRHSPWLRASALTSEGLPDLVLRGAWLGYPPHCDQSLKGGEASWAPAQVLQWLSLLGQVIEDSQEEFMKHPHSWISRNSWEKDGFALTQKHKSVLENLGIILEASELYSDLLNLRKTRETMAHQESI